MQEAIVPCKLPPAGKEFRGACRAGGVVGSQGKVHGPECILWRSSYVRTKVCGHFRGSFWVSLS